MFGFYWGVKLLRHQEREKSYAVRFRRTNFGRSQYAEVGNTDPVATFGKADDKLKYRYQKG